jgi:glyoxylate reductase
MTVLCSTPLPAQAARLLDGHELVVVGEGELDAALVDADGWVALLTDRVDAARLDRAPRLRVVANFAVGVNNVDLDAATARRVIVTHTPDVLTEATADLAFGLLLAAARRFHEGEALARSGAWRGWAPDQLLGAEVHGRTLGVVGLGRIGRAMAARARGFDLRVVYAGPRRAPAHLEWALEARHVPLDELLAEADFVSLHCPLPDETRHLVGARELARMKPGAVLVNTARGPIVDEAALADALARGHLGGAGLDVYEDEPRVHPALAASPRAVLLPHLGSATVATRARMAELAAGSVADVLAGRRPRHVANAEVLSLRPPSG